MNITSRGLLLMFICAMQDIPKQENSYDCGVFVGQVCKVYNSACHPCLPGWTCILLLTLFNIQYILYRTMEQPFNFEQVRIIIAKGLCNKCTAASTYRNTWGYSVKL